MLVTINIVYIATTYATWCRLWFCLFTCAVTFSHPASCSQGEALCPVEGEVIAWASHLDLAWSKASFRSLTLDIGGWTKGCALECFWIGAQSSFILGQGPHLWFIDYLCRIDIGSGAPSVYRATTPSLPWANLQQLAVDLCPTSWPRWSHLLILPLMM